MKVLAVFPDLNGPNPGGVQVAGQLAWNALQQHTDARALLVGVQKAPVARNDHEIVAYGRFRAIAAATALRFHPDAILVWHLDLLRLTPFIRTDAPRVLFVHGIEAWRRQDVMTRRLLRTSKLISNSHYTHNRILSVMPELHNSPIEIVHLGVPASRSPVKLPQALPAAVMVGRLDSDEQYKGHEEVIRAWPLVVARVPDAQLWIVGDGNLRHHLESLAVDLGLHDVIRFFGRVSETEKEALLNAARCLVLPSRAEGFGLVYLEAMRAGRPCLTGLDAGKEVINAPEAGFSVDPSDANGLTDAIVALLSDHEVWQRMSVAALQRYQANFTAEQFQARLLAALERLR